MYSLFATIALERGLDTMFGGIHLIAVSAVFWKKSFY